MHGDVIIVGDARHPAIVASWYELDAPLFASVPPQKSLFLAQPKGYLEQRTNSGPW
jgi:hypothetical protein